MAWKNVALASAVAGLFVAATAAPALAEGNDAKVKCEGVNECKGHSACKTAHNACHGKNACKGQGYLLMSQAECDSAKAKQAEKK